MKKHPHNEDQSKAEANTANEQTTQENAGEKQNRHKSPGEVFVEKKLQALSQKSPLELTVFEMTFLFGTRFTLCRIHGILHGFNGKHYYPIDRQTLESKILEVLFDELDERGDIRIIGSIVYIIEHLPLIDHEETADWVGFANGVLNIKYWTYYDYTQLKMRVVSPDNINFPQPAIPPQTPPEPPIITYNLQAAYNFSYPDLIMPTPIADKFFFEVTGNDSILMARIYEMIGYLLVPDSAAKSFFLLQGVPDSGKSILGRFLEGFFPPQCVTALDISRLDVHFSSFM